MATIEELLILLTGKDELSPSLKEGKENLGVFSEAVGNVQQMALGFAEGAFLVKGMEAIQEAVPAAMEKVLDFGEATHKLTISTGATAEQASSAIAVFERFGVSSDQAAGMLFKFEKNGKDAGVTGKGLAEDLFALSDKFNQTTDATERANLVQANFGRGGKEIELMLSQGSEKLRQVTEDAAKYGMVLNETNLQDVEAAVQGHKSFEEAVSGLQMQLAVALLPTLAQVSSGLGALAQVINADIMPAVKDLQGTASGDGGNGLSGIANAFLSLIKGATAAGLILGDVASIGGQAFDAMMRPISTNVILLQTMGEVLKDLVTGDFDAIGPAAQRGFSALSANAKGGFDELGALKDKILGLPDALGKAGATAGAVGDQVSAAMKRAGSSVDDVSGDAMKLNTELSKTAESFQRRFDDMATANTKRQRDYNQQLSDLDTNFNNSNLERRQGFFDKVKELNAKEADEAKQLTDRLAQMQADYAARTKDERSQVNDFDTKMNTTGWRTDIDGPTGVFEATKARIEAIRQHLAEEDKKEKELEDKAKKETEVKKAELAKQITDAQDAYNKWYTIEKNKTDVAAQQIELRYDDEIKASNTAKTRLIQDANDAKLAYDATTNSVRDLGRALNALPAGTTTRGGGPGSGNLAYASGGVIGEPVMGWGMNSGRSYTFGENGPETVTPGAGSGGGTGAGPTIVINVSGVVGDRTAVVETIRTELIKLGRMNGYQGYLSNV